MCNRSESFGAVLGGHMRSQTTPKRPHAARMAYVQRRTTQAALARAKIAHATLHNPPVTCAVTGGTRRSSAIAWAHAEASSGASWTAFPAAIEGGAADAAAEAA
eukprot:4312128-Prymnesium_polylepis.1